MAVTENQKLAIQLLNDGFKANEVAKRTGFSTEQLNRWINDPVFRRERYTDISVRFGSMVPKAMETLYEIMTEGIKDRDRLTAATEILDRAGFSVTKDVDIKITDERRPLNIDKMELQRALKTIEEETKRLEEMKDVTDVSNAIECEGEEVCRETSNNG